MQWTGLNGSKIGVTHKPSDDYDDGNFEISLAILYITDDVKCVLRGGLPGFCSVVDWGK